MPRSRPRRRASRPATRRKIARISDAAIRRERRAAHVALRVLVERAFGAAWRRVPYAVSATGKPSLAGAEGAFSLSHVPGSRSSASRGEARSASTSRGCARFAFRTTGVRGSSAAALDLAGGAPLPDAPERRSAAGMGAHRGRRQGGRLRCRAAADAPGRGALARALADAPAAPMPFAVHDLASGRGAGGAPSPCQRDHEAPAPRAFPADGAGIERLLNRLDC